ncbi:MarR family winged helix-turn-helix transcriptional regulator [Actinoplanes derwentensis]|uniref:DNA-binding transcriptional regulator, MarR family n=1 Tax=Actinoplanes derwentensis TaxID=113562 RepID=A0A1H1S4U0_9ACTN|nr:MarR family transcriptional regulator [Actinoplanes derwentensis]GID89666.1 MarR family transcriptional regulator [Actinoplanes derwentensis]SDS42756.1 DNA-binding transcriptional regulator, MarR family [Actinoplanes derwentensis]
MGQGGGRALPTREQLRVWRGYIETAEILRTRLAGRLQGESSLSSGDYQVLLALSEAEQRTLRSSALAVQIGWERSRLSHHLGRMEKRELIRRVSCPDDIHGVDVIMTDSGAEAFRASTVPHLRAIREVFVDALTAEQLAHVEELTVALRRHLDLPD